MTPKRYLWSRSLNNHSIFQKHLLPKVQSSQRNKVNKSYHLERTFSTIIIYFWMSRYSFFCVHLADIFITMGHSVSSHSISKFWHHLRILRVTNLYPKTILRDRKTCNFISFKSSHKMRRIEIDFRGSR